MCETDGVPVLERSSRNHTEMHNLILCRAPVKDEDTAPSTEQRLLSIEGRLDGIQSQFHGIQSHFDGMQSQFDDLRSRFGNIEQLLHKLVASSAGNTAQ